MDHQIGFLLAIFLAVIGCLFTLITFLFKKPLDMYEDRQAKLEMEVSEIKLKLDEIQKDVATRIHEIYEIVALLINKQK